MTSKSYFCGWCQRQIASSVGTEGRLPRDIYNNPMAFSLELMGADLTPAYVYICSHCGCPTLFAGQTQLPRASGRRVDHLPRDVERVYKEAACATANGAPTAAVLLLRTLISHVAVEKGAPSGEPFIAHVEYLVAKILAPDQKGWVDSMRKLANESAHDLYIASEQDAETMVNFAALMLQLVYEVPRQLAEHDKGREPAKP